MSQDTDPQVDVGPEATDRRDAGRQAQDKHQADGGPNRHPAHRQASGFPSQNRVEPTL
jgi:hypothetical protein